MNTTIFFQDGSKLLIDATPKADTSYSSRTTENKTEKGSIISDHIINDPIELSLDCVVSNVVTDKNKPSPEITARQALLKARNNKETIDIDTADQSFSDMVILDIGKSISTENGLAFVFTLQLKEVLIGIRKTTEKPLKKYLGKAKPNDDKPQAKKRKKKTQDQYSKKENKGLKPKKQPTTKQTAAINKVSAAWDSTFSSGVFG